VPDEPDAPPEVESSLEQPGTRKSARVPSASTIFIGDLRMLEGSRSRLASACNPDDPASRASADYRTLERFAPADADALAKAKAKADARAGAGAKADAGPDRRTILDAPPCRVILPV